MARERNCVKKEWNIGKLKNMQICPFAYMKNIKLKAAKAMNEICKKKKERMNEAAGKITEQEEMPPRSS